VSLPVEFSVRAEADLEGVADYIAFDNPRRAVSFVRQVRARCARIAEQPRANRLREEFGPGVRVAVHGSYLILYAERRGVLMIERVVHGARDLDRLEDG
jgi:toxin ParE1/3/4